MSSRGTRWILYCYIYSREQLKQMQKRVAKESTSTVNVLNMRHELQAENSKPRLRHAFAFARFFVMQQILTESFTLLL